MQANLAEDTVDFADYKENKKIAHVYLTQTGLYKKLQNASH